MIHCASNSSIYFDKNLSTINLRIMILMPYLININVSLSFYRVGILGIFGNLLTLLVLNRSKGTNFNQLLGFLSIIDMLLIICFILMSACTTGKNIKCLVQNRDNDLWSWKKAWYKCIKFLQLWNISQVGLSFYFHTFSGLWETYQ